jgi:triacylglycerol esterase/lipase EstA (alpha/beta hydrolase family)
VKGRLPATALLLCALVTPACQDSGRCAHRPVVMIHGFGGGPRAFGPLADALAREGWSRDDLVARAYPPGVSIARWGERVAAEAARLHARTGCRAALLGYSMGGLAARWAVRRGGAAPDVAGVITAGSPHHGTALAGRCDEPACVEMRAGSAFLAGLGESAEEGPAVVSIASRVDAVAPPATASLDGARNVVVCCPPHNRLFNEEVLGVVREALSNMKGN